MATEFSWFATGDSSKKEEKYQRNLVEYFR